MSDWWEQLDTDQGQNEQKAKKLVNVLARFPGDKAQKLKWLVTQMPLLEGEARKKYDPAEQPREFGAEMVTLTFRFWRAKHRRDKGLSSVRGSPERPQQMEPRGNTLAGLADVLKLPERKEEP